MSKEKKLEKKPKEKSGSWWMLKNSGGKKDVALTMMMVTWLLCMGLAVAGAFGSVEIEGMKIVFQEFNMGFATTVLVPLIGLYFGRRYSDTQKGLYETQSLWSKNEAKTKDED